MIVIGWFKLQLWMWLVDLNYNFECDWLIELSDNNLAGELVENRIFFKTIHNREETVIFMISYLIGSLTLHFNGWSNLS